MRYLDFLPADVMAKLDQCPDLAFSLDSEGHGKLDIDYGGSPVGITIVNHKFEDQDARQRYIDTIIESVAYLASQWDDAKFYIFPQVLSRHVDGSVDIQFARVIAEECSAKRGITLQIVTGDHDPRELQRTYAHMQCFIATRLHSAIFAASVGVPTIVFGYHGTKAEGIWQEIGYPHLFFHIESINWPDVERGLDVLVGSGEEVRNDLRKRCAAIRNTIMDVVDAEVNIVSR